MDPLLFATFPIAVCRNKSLLTGKPVREFDSYCQRSTATLLRNGREVSYKNKLNIPGHTQQRHKKIIEQREKACGKEKFSRRED